MHFIVACSSEENQQKVCFIRNIIVDDFIKFLPVLCYENGVMKVLSASDVLDMAMNNTSATLLARQWESALLVNVDNFTLQRLMNNKEAMAALMKIEGFRSLNYRHDTYQVPVIF